MKTVCLPHLLYAVTLFILTACQTPGQLTDPAMLKPGDVIDGMRLTTGAADAVPLWVLCDSDQRDGNTISSYCTVPALPRLGIGDIFMVADDGSSEFDLSEPAWGLSIDGQPVDLEAFGTFDYVMPVTAQKPSQMKEIFKMFTAWDIVLTNLQPGEHTLRGLAQTKTDSYDWVIHLTITPNTHDMGGSRGGRYQHPGGGFNRRCSCRPNPFQRLW